jgi:hypothetical protein
MKRDHGLQLGGLRADGSGKWRSCRVASRFLTRLELTQFNATEDILILPTTQTLSLPSLPATRLPPFQRVLTSLVQYPCLQSISHCLFRQNVLQSRA